MREFIGSLILEHLKNNGPRQKVKFLARAAIEKPQRPDNSFAVF